MGDLNSRDEQMSKEVASMAELGRFEKEVTVYGCAFYDNRKVMYVVSEKAEKIYDFRYDIKNVEKFPSNIHVATIRALVPAGTEKHILAEVRNILLDELYNLYDEKYFQKICDLHDIPRTNDAYLLLKELQYQLDGVCNKEQLQLFQGLIEVAYCRKVIFEEPYFYFKQWINWTTQDLEQELERTDFYEKVFYGFAYFKDDQPVKVYIEGHKSNLYKRLEQKKSEGYIVSSIIWKKCWYNNQYSIVQAKNDCEKYFAEVYEKWYIEAITQLYQLPSPFCMRKIVDI